MAATYSKWQVHVPWNQKQTTSSHFSVTELSKNGRHCKISLPSKNSKVSNMFWFSSEFTTFITLQCHFSNFQFSNTSFAQVLSFSATRWCYTFQSTGKGEPRSYTCIKSYNSNNNCYTKMDSWTSWLVTLSSSIISRN